MRIRELICVAVVTFFMGVFASNPVFGQEMKITQAGAKEEVKKMESEVNDKPSYAMGFVVGSQLAQTGITADFLKVEDFVKGFLAALGGDQPLISNEQMGSALQEMQSRATEKAQAKSASNKKEGEDFLASNKSKEGVVALESGLQYKVLKSGDGAKPSLSDTVKVHYHGTLIDGTVFDSSVERGEPIEFPVGGVIPGWTEALQRMKVGDKWQLYIPSNLAYGERGSPPKIGPNSVLIFEVDLLGVK